MRRNLGLGLATALVAGNMIGSGVFLLPSSLGPYGGIGLVGWLVTGVGAMLCAVTFARLARLFPHPGGPYAYTRIAFGDFAGFLVAWGYWLSICAGNAAIAVAFVGYSGYFWPALSHVPLLSAAAAIASVWFLTWVNARGVRVAGIVQAVTTALKIVPLLAIGTFGLVFFRLEHLQPFNASGMPALSAIATTAALTLWAFLGLESATVPAGEVEDPERTIPRATLLGTGVAALVFLLGTVGVMGILSPSTLAESTAPFADAARDIWGPWGAALIAAGGAIACFGALNGWILLQGQLPMAAAADGLLPVVFGQRSRRGTPTPALLISSVLVSAIVATNYAKGLVAAYTFIILLATLTTLVPYVFCSMALVLSALRGHVSDGDRSVSKAVTLGTLAFLYSLMAIVGAGPKTVYWGFVLLIAGIPAYVWLVRHRSTRSESTPSP